MRDKMEHRCQIFQCPCLLQSSPQPYLHQSLVNIFIHDYFSEALILGGPLASSVGRMLSMEFHLPEIKAIPISEYYITYTYIKLNILPYILSIICIMTAAQHR